MYLFWKGGIRTIVKSGPCVKAVAAVLEFCSAFPAWATDESADY